MYSLAPEHVEKIRQYLQNGQKIQAIAYYRQISNTSLKEAKEAIEELESPEIGQFTRLRAADDDPVLESKLRSLLIQGKKIEAIKLYRERYGVNLKKAKQAIDSMQSGMPIDPGTSLPYESAIGRDPFAEDNTRNRRMLVLMGIVLAIGLCLGTLMVIGALNP